MFLRFQEHLFCVFRYITALTDSEEDEPSDCEHADQEQPEDELYVLLERIDRLHQGTDSDKRESLQVLLEHREEVCTRPPALLFWEATNN